MKYLTPAEIKKLPAARALLEARYTKEQIERPFVAVLYCYNEVTPGHFNHQKLAEAIEKGVEEAGGTPMGANVGIGACDGIAMGHAGMNWILPCRWLNANCVEAHIRTHGFFEGAVYVGGCDKHIPGYLMGAARVNLPSIFVTSGPAEKGYCDVEWCRDTWIDVADAFAAEAQLAAGRITQGEYDKIVSAACKEGSCQGLYTANTMACSTEALGLTLPMMATTHATDPKKYYLAKESGRRIMGLIKEGTTIRDIVTKDAIKNAFTLDLLFGGSTNTALHLPAIAREIDYDLDFDEMNKLSDIAPNITRIAPSKGGDKGDKKYGMEDLHKAGGVFAIMKEAKKKGLIRNTMTVDGPMFYVLEKAENLNQEVIRPIDNPYSQRGGLIMLDGNMGKGLIKGSGVDSSIRRFDGIARVFNSEEDATAYVKGGKLKKGDFLVIRYLGELGAPGMPEMLYVTSGMVGLGMQNVCAGVTDARFSGATSGPWIGHIKPEAIEGGTIALVEEGDRIKLDLDAKRIDLLVEESVLSERRKNWKPPKQEVPFGLLQDYRNYVKLAQ